MFTDLSSVQTPYNRFSYAQELLYVKLFTDHEKLRVGSEFQLQLNHCQVTLVLAGFCVVHKSG